MEVSAENHLPAALTTEKESPVPTEQPEEKKVHIRECEVMNLFSVYNLNRYT
jgi:hypothetical protein